MEEYHSSTRTRLFSLSALLGLSVVMLFAVARSGHGEDPQTFNENATAVSAADRHAERAAASVSPTVIPRQVSGVPELSAHSYLVQFVGEHEPILKSREWKEMKPASLTKIMTAVLAEEELGPDAHIVFSEDAKRVEEKVSPARQGDIFLRDDVIRLALIPSANDAATALAEAVGQKYGAFTFKDAMDVFVNAMNRKAQAIGMNSSAFRNPTGLDDDTHYTTAADLFTLVSYVWNHHPDLWAITRQLGIQAVPVNGSALATMPATDVLLGEFPGILGGKTGLTDGAKQTLILLYPVQERIGQNEIPKTAVIVLLGSDDRFGDGRKVIQWLEETF